MKSELKQQRRASRARRTHAKARVSGKPRLIVFKSIKAIYAQIMDDSTGKVVCGSSNLKGASGIKGAEEVGAAIAKAAIDNKIDTVVFDRNGYIYHGQVKMVAEAARKAGLKF